MRMPRADGITSAAALLAVGGCLLGLPSAARAATFSGTNGLIAYSQFDGGTPGAQIMTVDPASGAVKDLSKKTYGDDQPEFSPSGALIVFRHGADIWTMDAKGGKRTDLTPGSHSSYADPSWSPDGSAIVFADNGEIATMRANGTGITLLTGNGDNSTPDWSPDGTLIAFDSYHDAGDIPHVFVMRPDGSHVTDLSHVTDTGDQYYDETPSWSADSSHVVVASDRPVPPHVAPIQVWSLSRTGSTAAERSMLGSNAAGPVTSPDGSDLAYTASPGDGTNQICLASGGCITRGPDTAIGEDASWQAVVHPVVKTSPAAGKPGATVRVTLSGYADGDTLTLTLHDGGTSTVLATVTADGTGKATSTVAVPAGAAPGKATIVGTGSPSGRTASAKLTVKGS